jgi:hypothetical protein
MKSWKIVQCRCNKRLQHLNILIRSDSHCLLRTLSCSILFATCFRNLLLTVFKPKAKTDFAWPPCCGFRFQKTKWPKYKIYVLKL